MPNGAQRDWWAFSASGLGHCTMYQFRYHQVVSADELLNTTNEYIHHHQDARLIKAVTCKIMCGMMGGHKDVVKIVQPTSIDPRWAEQATEDTRATIFFKLDAYTLSCCMKWDMSVEKATKIWRQPFWYGLSWQWHHKSLLQDHYWHGSHHSLNVLDHARRGYKINMHVTTCITNCAKGCYEDKENEVHQAYGTLLIDTHSTSKIREGQGSAN